MDRLPSAEQDAAGICKRAGVGKFEVLSSSSLLDSTPHDTSSDNKNRDISPWGNWFSFAKRWVMSNYVKREWIVELAYNLPSSIFSHREKLLNLIILIVIENSSQKKLK